MKVTSWRNLHLSLSLLALSTLAPNLRATGFPVDQGCESSEAWVMQMNVRSDPSGRNNFAFPEANATYWTTPLSYPLGTVVTVKGRYANARYIALQVYDSTRSVRDAISDQDMNPDAGENNPYRTGTQQGTYTVTLVFGPKPSSRAPNTIYSDGLTEIDLMYRVYYPNNTDDLSGGAFNPVLPNVYLGQRLFITCPLRPFISPESTPWSRLDNSDWAGTIPTSMIRATTDPPTWKINLVDNNGNFYPSADNSYLYAATSRKYLLPPYNKDMLVISLYAPTYPNTQAGEPPYLAASSRQVRFWSVCQNEPQTTGVNRCLPDNQLPLINGYATIVVSDPSKKPSSAALAQFGAVWMNWGALQPGDFLYDINGNKVYNDQPVYFYGGILYRQTLANPTFTQSILNVGLTTPQRNWAKAMGQYWPAIGYCRASDFSTFGAQCIGK